LLLVCWLSVWWYDVYTTATPAQPLLSYQHYPGEIVYESVQNLRLYEQIVKQITNLIAKGTLTPGDQLPSERELAQQFGVSRTAVREAVKALRQKGLVAIRPGRGTYITDVFDTATGVVRDSLALMVQTGLNTGLNDLLQVRMLLEPGIAALAAEKATEKEIETMHQLILKMDSALKDQEAFVEADLEFHLKLAKASQNSLIPILIDPVIDLLREQRMRIFEVRGGAERGQFHHRKIFEAVKLRNPEAARAAMKAHLEQVVQDSTIILD
jgi:GntR family transcriptional regulator, transcriptional repressor for pyruvate dehydrogenase complex